MSLSAPARFTVSLVTSLSGSARARPDRIWLAFAALFGARRPRHDQVGQIWLKTIQYPLAPIGGFLAQTRLSLEPGPPDLSLSASGS